MDYGLIGKIEKAKRYNVRESHLRNLRLRLKVKTMTIL